MKISTVVVGALILGTGVGVGNVFLQTEYLYPWANRPQAKGSLPPRQPAPKLVLEGDPFHQFGVMQPGTIGKHHFTIHNRGDAPLRIKQGTSTCHCTVTSLGGDADAQNPDKTIELAPGKSAEVAMEWNTTGYTGAFSQSATFETNDPNQRRFNLAIHGRILSAFVSKPAELVFSTLVSRESAEASVAVLSYQEGPFDRIQATLDDADLAPFFEFRDEPLPEAEVKQDAEAHGGRRLFVRIKPGLPLGPLDKKITLRFGEAANSPTLDLPTKGFVTGEFSVMGSGWSDSLQRLSFGAISQEKGGTATLQVMARGPDRGDVQLELEKVVPEQLQVTIDEAKEVADGTVTRIPVTIQIPPGMHVCNYMGPEEDQLGLVVLKTHHPLTPELRFHVRFAVVK